MDYSLALQLKEAGFPQKFVDGRKAIVNSDNTAYCFEPTLEELIEACGEKLWGLTRHGNIWQTNWRDGIGGETSGRTPLEAVAHLYLALNPLN